MNENENPNKNVFNPTYLPSCVCLVDNKNEKNSKKRKRIVKTT